MNFSGKGLKVIFALILPGFIMINGMLASPSLPCTKFVDLLVK